MHSTPLQVSVETSFMRCNILLTFLYGVAWDPFASGQEHISEREGLPTQEVECVMCWSLPWDMV
ncbi:MAG: hypothetical protein JWM43_2044 [Acidobacteriaceae bacterium]|nr:hypothetical protein [Acidobacteriaceae bacterium]